MHIIRRRVPWSCIAHNGSSSNGAVTELFLLLISIVLGGKFCPHFCKEKKRTGTKRVKIILLHDTKPCDSTLYTRHHLLPQHVGTINKYSCFLRLKAWTSSSILPRLKGFSRGLSVCFCMRVGRGGVIFVQIHYTSYIIISTQRTRHRAITLNSL